MPPDIETHGVDEQPTLVNNVETFAWVPSVYLKGAAWYQQQRRRLFSVSGDLAQPGVYEMPMDSTLGELVRKAGGTLGAAEVGAVAPSGPSGGFLPRHLPAAKLHQDIVRKLRVLRAERPRDEIRRLIAFGRTLKRLEKLDVLDLPLDGTLFRNLGLSLGAGIVVYQAGTDIFEQALNCLEFFERESCGKCVPCRLGCQQLVEIATDPANRQALAPGGTLFERISDLNNTMKLTAICGLGRTAAKPLMTALRHFPPETAGERT